MRENGLVNGDGRWQWFATKMTMVRDKDDEVQILDYFHKIKYK